MRRVALVLLALAATGCGGGRSPLARNQAIALPREGVAVQTFSAGGDRLELVGLDGRVYARSGLRLDPDSELYDGVVVLRGHGHRLAVDADRGRFVRYRSADWADRRPDQPGPGGCDVFATRGRRQFSVCSRSSGGSRIELAGPAGVETIAGRPPHATVGSWYRAYLSPDGRTVLALWSAECEVPTAFFVDASGGGLRTVTGHRDWRRAPESKPLGWAPDGRAVVQLFQGACGYGYRAPGIYLIDPRTGAHRLVVATRRAVAYLWHA